MADVKIVDIDGEQWNIKDQDAREKVAIIEKNISTQGLPDGQVTLENGYTCKSIKILSHYKAGNIHFAMIRIHDLSGEGIGSTNQIKIASTNLKPKSGTSFILRDYRAPATARGVITANGDLCLEESNGIKNGYNVMLGEIIFAEP